MKNWRSEKRWTPRLLRQEMSLGWGCLWEHPNCTEMEESENWIPQLPQSWDWGVWCAPEPWLQRTRKQAHAVVAAGRLLTRHGHGSLTFSWLLQTHHENLCNFSSLPQKEQLTSLCPIHTQKTAASSPLSQVRCLGSSVWEELDFIHLWGISKYLSTQQELLVTRWAVLVAWTFSCSG